MANQPKSVDATFYAVVTPEWSRWYKDDPRSDDEVSA
jgi:hypothetical protein